MDTASLLADPRWNGQLRIPKLRKGSYFPGFLEQQRIPLMDEAEPEVLAYTTFSK